MTSTQFMDALAIRLGGVAYATAVWPRDEITAASLRALMKVAERVNPTFELKVASLTQTITGDGTSTEFNLASDFMSALHLEIDDTIVNHDSFRIINQRDPDDVDEDDADTPLAYIRTLVVAGTTQFRIGILPILESGATATLHYIAYPTITTVATALADIPPQFHEAALIYAEWELKHKNMRAKDLADVYVEFERSLVEASRYNQGWVDRFPQMLAATTIDDERYEQDW